MIDATTDCGREPAKQSPPPNPGNHASDETLVALAEGFLLLGRVEELRAHLLTCTICRDRAGIALQDKDGPGRLGANILTDQDADHLAKLVRQTLQRIPADELQNANRRRVALIRVRQDLIGTSELPGEQQLAFLLALADGVEQVDQETAVARLTDRAGGFTPREALDRVAPREDPLSIGYRLIHYAAVLPEVVAKLLGRPSHEVQSDYEYVSAQLDRGDFG